MTVFAFELTVLKSGLISLPRFWISIGIVTFFQLISNGFLAGQKIVVYNPDLYAGARIAYAPLEDLFFGFALVSLIMFVWTKIKPTEKRVKKSRAAKEKQGPANGS